MVLFNHAAHQMAAKIVYYGPGLCGKTTSLCTVYQRSSDRVRGEMVSLDTDTDRTLFFDLLPMDMGMVWGFRTKLQLYTVPGQVFYNTTRKLVLSGADGIVFVADSQDERLEANRESLRNLDANLKELGVDLLDLPMVFQWNKRDLSGIVPVETLERELNPRGLPSFSTVASEGIGVFESLKEVARQTLLHIRRQHFTESGFPVMELSEPTHPEPPPVRVSPPPPSPSTPPPPVQAPAESRPVLKGKVSVPTPLRPRIVVPPPPRVPMPRVQIQPVAVPRIHLVPPVRATGGAAPSATREASLAADPDSTAT